MTNLVALLLSLIVAATGITRAVDPGLTAIAEQRAVEVSCDGCFTHAGARGGTWEVLAWNGGYPGDAAAVVAFEGWRGSPDHWRTLAEPSLTRIGCGHHHVAERHYFACVLDSGATNGGGPADPSSAPSTSATPPPPAPLELLPNTSTAP